MGFLIWYILLFAFRQSIQQVNIIQMTLPETPFTQLWEWFFGNFKLVSPS